MKFSIIIPTYNRAHFLQKCLPTLNKLTYPINKYEVLVVDNNSSDETKKVIFDFIRKNPQVNVRYLFEKRQGHVFACNSAVRITKYSKIIFIDDDIDIAPNFLEQYKLTYKQFTDAFIIGGPIKAKFPVGRKRFLQHLRKDDLWIMGECYWGEECRQLVYPEVIFSGNMSVSLTRKEKKTPLFEEQLGHPFKNGLLYGQDYELCLRAHLQKRKIIYNPQILVTNLVEDNRLHFRYVLKRQLMAGLERLIIDQKLKRFPRHEIYQFRAIWLLIGFLRSLSRARKQFIHLEDLTFAIGYYVLGKIYFSWAGRQRARFSLI